MTRRMAVIETERLRIRELTMADLETVHRILSETGDSETPLEVRERWLQWTVLGYEMFAMLEQPHYGERGISLKQTGKLIGAIGTVPYIDSFGHIAAFNRRPESPATAEVGLYWAIAPAEQGRGYATEAARGLTAYLFEHVGLGRIIATTGYDNLASQAVMRKLGMTVERARRPHSDERYVVGVLQNSATEES